MPPEDCAVCGDTVPFETTVHLLVNAKHRERVSDHYVCRGCFEEHLDGLFESAG